MRLRILILAKKSKFYVIQEFMGVRSPRYMVGEHREQMVRHDPAPKDQPRR